MCIRDRVYTAFSRSGLTGWTVAAGAPMTLVTTDLYRSIAWLALGTLAAFGLGLWLALRLANRLTSAVQGLVGPALALGEGRTDVYKRQRITVHSTANARTHASRQADALQGHGHELWYPFTGTTSGSGSLSVSLSTNPASGISMNYASGSLRDSGQGTPRNAKETRPVTVSYTHLVRPFPRWFAWPSHHGLHTFPHIPHIFPADRHGAPS